MYKVIIAGSRDFNDYELLKERCDYYLQNKGGEVIVVSGAARGADLLGERYAKEHKYLIESHPAAWDKYGKSAGYKRNVDMAESADGCICFWDGKSKGTKHMIDIATEKGLDLRIVRYV